MFYIIIIGLESVMMGSGMLRIAVLVLLLKQGTLYLLCFIILGVNYHVINTKIRRVATRPIDRNANGWLKACFVAKVVDGNNIAIPVSPLLWPPNHKLI